MNKINQILNKQNNNNNTKQQQFRIYSKVQRPTLAGLTPSEWVAKNSQIKPKERNKNPIPDKS
jgi:hypothetical protein